MDHINFKCQRPILCLLCVLLLTSDHRSAAAVDRRNVQLCVVQWKICGRHSLGETVAAGRVFLILYRKRDSNADSDSE